MEALQKMPRQCNGIAVLEFGVPTPCAWMWAQIEKRWDAKSRFLEIIYTM